jgi:CHAD domain-containing protein
MQATLPDNSTPDGTVPAFADHVCTLALILFDRTRPLHGLKEESRSILEAAALMVEIPFPPGKKKPHKAAQALVKEFAAPQLTSEEQKVLAAVIAFHHRQIKKKDLDRFDLSPAQQRETLTIAALLRIAAGLNDSHSGTTHILQVEPTRDGLWIVVEGPQAISDAQVAQHCTRLWDKIGYPPVTLMETAEAALKLLPFPSPDEKFIIFPNDPLSEAARKVMCYQFALMLKNEPGTRYGEDIEALHDMRVATRRLRAAFEVFKEAFEPGALKQYLKGLRATGRALGAVRDLDVFIEKAQNYLASLPPDQHEDLSLLIQIWEAQRQEARQKMLVYLDSPDYAIFKREFNTFLLTPGAGAAPVQNGMPVPNQVRELAPVLIYNRLASVISYDLFIPNAPIERLHALRIEFKKLRYTVEYFRDVLGPDLKVIIDDLKQLQDHLGEIMDANVAAKILQDFIDQALATQSSDPEHLDFVRNYLHYRITESQRLIETFPAAWEHFKRPEWRSKLASAIASL